MNDDPRELACGFAIVVLLLTCAALPLFLSGCMPVEYKPEGPVPLNYIPMPDGIRYYMVAEQ